jgi:hypothetical protein
MMYEAECEGCGLPFDYVASVKDYQIVPPCPACAAPARKVVRTAPMGVVTGKFEPFRSTVDGSLIQNQHDLKEHNRRNGVVNLNDGYSEEKLISGDFGQKKPTETIKDKAQDVIEAIHAVKAGYKPEVQKDE